MAANYEMNKLTKNGWTKQPNAILRDKNLTSDAYKVISFLLSITGDYHINIRGISNTINISESKVRRATALLQKIGYLKIEKIKLGKVFGYRWHISDVSGVYGESTDGTSIDEQSMDGMSIGDHIYEYTERNEQINKERQKLKKEEEKRESPPTLTPLFQPEKNIISSGELNIQQAFNRFCELYPRIGDRKQAQEAFFQIPDISNICWQITNSIEWFEKLKRWDDWETGQKNKYCPQAVKFLSRGDWQEYMRSEATTPIRDRLDALFPDEEDEI